MACVAVWAYFFAIVYVDYMKCYEKLQYVDYDVKTTTAGDYTAMFKISADQYDYFITHYH